MSCFGLRDAAPLHVTDATARDFAGRPPLEDLGTTKRRLVCIRRQRDAAPVALDAGFKSRTGWQPLGACRENQDSLAVVLPFAEPVADCSLFAVFDGHGRNGHRVSAFVAERIAAEMQLTLHAEGRDVPAALNTACARTNRALRARPKLDLQMTGTTAAIALVKGRQLFCANVGDSRIVIGRVADALDARAVSVQCTEDQVPQRVDECARIERAGGRVERWAPAGLDTGPARVWLKERRLPGLSMSRAFGDTILDGIVTPVPEISRFALDVCDSFIVVATDGIWAHMSSADVVEYVSARRHEPSQRVVESLVKHAARLWYEDAGETIDDISAIVIFMHW